MFLSIINFNNFIYVYRCIRKSYKNKRVISKFKLFLNCNLVSLILKMQSNNFAFKKYNIFLIKEPKYRLIMSEDLDDKIINQIFSRFILVPYLSNSLLECNVATRENKGAKKAHDLTEKYLRKLTYENKEIFALKIDISKYFYNIDHDILVEKVSKIIKEEGCINFLRKILDTTNQDYVNEDINKIILEEKERISLLNISSKEKELKYNELDKLPRYKKGKGLPIGNLSSQILAIFYLSDIDHFIKEKLRCKCYVRYMDDLLLLSTDKEYLKKCFKVISEKINDNLLDVNKKSNLYKCSKGFEFLGYRYFVKNNKISIRYRKDTMKRIKKRLNNLIENDYEKFMLSKASYKGYFMRCFTPLGNKIMFSYNFNWSDYEDYKYMYKEKIIILYNSLFYTVYYDDAEKINEYFNKAKFIKKEFCFSSKDLSNVINYIKSNNLDYVII